LILVTGATGKVGRNVVSELLAGGTAVRALARNPETSGLPAGAEVVRGDVSAPATLDGGADGVDAVFLLWPLLTSDAAPAVVDALAGRARRVVYLSSEGVREHAERQAGPIIQFHADLERLVEASGLEWTFLRPTGFAGNTLGWAPQVRAEGVVRAPFATMARPLIHERDIAAVAARVLTEAGHAGARYVLSGPRLETTVDQVRAIGEAVGRRLDFEEIAPEVARDRMVGEGWPPSLVDSMLRAQAAMAADPEPVTSTVEELTGAPARSFREWARDHAADFS
jgi:uncharacterized protein YbjT (DUF2867 family)